MTGGYCLAIKQEDGTERPVDILKDVIEPLKAKNFELVQKMHILEKQLKIATKALKKYMTFCRHPAEEALKEMEGVK